MVSSNRFFMDVWYSYGSFQSTLIEMPHLEPEVIDVLSIWMNYIHVFGLDVSLCNQIPISTCGELVNALTLHNCA